MLSISQKGTLMPESPIRKLVPFAEKAEQRGVKIYYLNIGQPDIETPKIALNAVKKNESKILKYTHSAGNYSYRKKLVEYYKKNDIHISVDDILITTGGSEAILFALNTCLNSGDEIIIPEPFYANYAGFAISLGIEILPVLSSIESDFQLPQISDFEALITKKTKAILICNPNNPTGYQYTNDELTKLKNIVKKHNLYLFSDEVYREFCYNEKHFSALQLEEIDENIVLLDSVSKRYSECGIRIGTLISKNKKIIATSLKFAQARLSPPLLGQIVAEASLDTSSNYFINVRNEYKKRRNFLVKALNEIPGVYTPTPKGTFYTIAKLPVKVAEHFSQWLLEHYTYKNKTVMLTPASGFYITKGAGLNEVRIAYVLKLEDLKNAVEVLKNALKPIPLKSKI